MHPLALARVGAQQDTKQECDDPAGTSPPLSPRERTPQRGQIGPVMPRRPNPPPRVLLQISFPGGLAREPSRLGSPSQRMKDSGCHP